MQDQFGTSWTRQEARRHRRMLRQMDRLSAPGPYAAPRPRRPRTRRILIALVVVLGLLAYALGTHAFAEARAWWAAGSGPSTPARSTAYSFMAVQPGSKDFAVSYDGCQPLHYRVNLTGAPKEDPDGKFVFEAVARVEKASGLDFVYDGPTSQRPHWGVPVTGGPILITFAEPDEVGELDGNVVGVGGSARVRRGNLQEYVTGSVTLDQDGIAAMFSRPFGHEEARAVVMHELGHVLGLGHVHDRHEVMNTSVGATDWGPGDLTGLRIVGHGPCF